MEGIYELMSSRGCEWNVEIGIFFFFDIRDKGEQLLFVSVEMCMRRVQNADISFRRCKTRDFEQKKICFLESEVTLVNSRWKRYGKFGKFNVFFCSVKIGMLLLLSNMTYAYAIHRNRFARTRLCACSSFMKSVKSRENEKSLRKSLLFQLCVDIFRNDSSRFCVVRSKLIHTLDGVESSISVCGTEKLCFFRFILNAVESAELARIETEK